MYKLKFAVILFISFSLLYSCKTTVEADPYTSFNYKFLQDETSVPDSGKDSFTIAVIPDIQNYTIYRCQQEYNPKLLMNYRDILNRQMKFVAKNTKSNGGNINFAIFLGDIVSKRNDYPEEWVYADEGISILDGQLPFGVVIGNHDYDKWKDRKKPEPFLVSGSKYFVRYFGPESKHFAEKSWYHSDPQNPLNSYIVFNGGGIQILFIGLEFEPSDEAIAWAQTVIDSNRDKPCIITTHGFLSMAKEKGSGNNRFITLRNHKEGEGNSGTVLFNKLARPNKSVFLVLCGHAFSGPNGEGMRVDLNKDGFKVYSVLSNYQGRADTFRAYGFEGPVEENGDGFLRLMHFDLKKNVCHVQTYSTEFNTFEIDADSDFLIDLDWNNRFDKK